jgi:hypothetical protein
MKRTWLVAVAFSTGACIDAAQEEVSLPLSLAGSAEAASFDNGRGFTIELSQAELAFGPLYVCAGATAGRLCETALLEWTDGAVVDVLSSKAKRVGALTGLTGRARSFMYDLGLVSLLPEQRPRVLNAARELGGHSVRLRGIARTNAVRIPFRANLTIQQTEETEQGTPVVRSGTGNDLAHTIRAGQALTVRFDARAWFQTANFALWLEERNCEPDGPSVVCDGQTELTCADDGTPMQSRDCAERDQVCIAGEGCVKELLVDPASQVGAALRIDLTSSGLPEFIWSR